MTLDELKHIKADRRMLVKHGRTTVTARFCRFATTKQGEVELLVQKFHLRSNSFGNVVRIAPDTVLKLY